MQNIKECIRRKILARFSPDGDRRLEAVKEVLLVAAPQMEDDAAASVARLIPELPFSLYEKWAGLFADRLLETVALEVVRELCGAEEENEAALALTYIMFMESERMEKTVAEDLKNLGASQCSPDEAATLVGAWLKTRMGGKAGEGRMQ